MSECGMTAQELMERLGGALRHCPPDRLLVEVKPLADAGPASVGFLSNPKYREAALSTGAGLILASPDQDLGEQPTLAVMHPYWAFAQVTGWLHPEPEPGWTEAPIHPSALISEGCRIAPGVTLGARTTVGRNCVFHPGVHIAEDCSVGDDCEIFSGVVLYRRTKVGDRVRIHANTVLGSDGYGYVLVEGRHEKIPQVGWVEVGDDAELGACVTVDRGALGPTRIGAGTKVDNLCQIAHNVQIGDHCLIVGQTGIAGSAKIGHHVTFAGRAGAAGHITIGPHSVLTTNAVACKDFPEGSFISGMPARPHRQWMESQSALNRLPGLMKELRKKRS